MARFASASWLFEDNLMNDVSASVTLDEFGFDFFPVNAPAPAKMVQQPALSKLSMMIPVVCLDHLSKKPLVTKAGTAAEYRRSVAIPRYLDKKLRRKWTKELMHPSRSAAAHRRPRNGGQFGVVHAVFKAVGEE